MRGGVTDENIESPDEKADSGGEKQDY